MKYDPARYGEVVEDYDGLYPGIAEETDAAVELVASLAHRFTDPTVLEFGIGTGRLALPLQARGIRVAGIDGSARMVAAMRAKPGGHVVDVEIGDYRDARHGRAPFSVVVLAFNGIFDPRGSQCQLDIFRNAARHLRPGGLFVVESWVMSDEQRSGEWSVMPRYVGAEHLELQLARYDITTNSIERTLVHLRPSGLNFVTVTDTYAAPGELDIMAKVMGFDRVARYSGWNRQQFLPSSRNQISVFSLRA